MFITVFSVEEWGTVMRDMGQNMHDGSVLIINLE